MLLKIYTSLKLIEQPEVAVYWHDNEGEEDMWMFY